MSTNVRRGSEASVDVEDVGDVIPKAPTSARAVASYILSCLPRASLRKLEAVLYYARAECYLNAGTRLFNEPIFKTRDGVRIATITPEWYRRERVQQRRAPCRQKALAQRVRRWTIQEALRHGGPQRIGQLHISIPGGWSDTDAVAQRAGLRAGLRVLRGSRRRRAGAAT